MTIHQSDMALWPLTGEATLLILLRCSVLLGKPASCYSNECYFDMYHLPKHLPKTWQRHSPIVLVSPWKTAVGSRKTARKGSKNTRDSLRHSPGLPSPQMLHFPNRALSGSLSFLKVEWETKHFSYQALLLWNQLLVWVQEADTLSTCKIRLNF